MFTIPAVSDFKIQFYRDFPYGGTNGDLTTVQDQDITRAIENASINFNQDLFSDQVSFNNGFLLLTAHFLVMNLRASSQGMNGKFPWLQQSKGVGSVSESFAIPQRILDNPEFAMLAETNYGAQFLMLTIAQLSGQVFVVRGATLP